MDFRSHVKTAFLSRTASEILQEAPSVLIGVTQDAEDALRLLGITSVYDLALSTIFANAARILDASTNESAVIHQHGVAPSDVIDQSSRGVPLDELPNRPIEALIGIGPQNTQVIGPALDVRSIRDFAQWPPYSAAKRVFVSVLAPDRAQDFDSQAPADLLPRSGRFATQRVSYKTTVLLNSKASTKPRMWDGGLVDTTVLDAVGFGQIAFGAVLTFSQRWSPRAVALGQLLHSVPLAPGESTKVTVLDWVRRSIGRRDEDIQQADELTATMEESTSISEVTHAVAREMQEGSSTSGSTSTSNSQGAAGMIPMFFVGGGASENASNAATYTVSSGTRTTSADSVQNIAARTQQNSALSRNRRAAVVSEISDSETEQITTRSVTNFNHMHSLSIQYFEVVQLYETQINLEKCERCIFIPMALVNLRKEANIRRYLPVLIRSALDRESRALLLAYRTNVVASFSIDRFGDSELAALDAAIGAMTSAASSMTIGGPVGSNNVGLNPTAPGILPLPDQLEKAIQLRTLRAEIGAVRAGLRSNYGAARSKRLLSDFDGRFSTMSIGASVEIAGASWRVGDGVASVQLNLLDGDVVEIAQPADMAQGGTSGRITPGITVDRIGSISVRINVSATANPSDFGVCRVHLLLRRGTRTPHWLDVSFVASKRAGAVTLINIQPPVDVREIADRLMQDQLYYSQQIWLRADRQSLIMQLAPFVCTFDNGAEIRLVDYIDPTPVTVAGNYLAFPCTYESDDDWTTWRDREFRETTARKDLVPMATGGVFAEAVLGEFNSAEKLDATRFWRWEESPIPNQAPEIAAAEAGRHTAVEAPVPRGLPQAGIALQTPIPLPALAGSDQVLRTLVANTIFRDMGGLDITAKLLAASLDAARKGDEAGAQMAKKTADAYLAAVDSVVKSVVSGGGQLLKTSTQLGGVLNSKGGGIGSLLGGSGGIGGAGGVISGAMDAIGGSAGLAGIVEEIGPLVSQLAPMLLSLI